MLHQPTASSSATSVPSSAGCIVDCRVVVAPSQRSASISICVAGRGARPTVSISSLPDLGLIRLVVGDDTRWLYVGRNFPEQRPLWRVSNGLEGVQAPALQPSSQSALLDGAGGDAARAGDVFVLQTVIRLGDRSALVAMAVGGAAEVWPETVQIAGQGAQGLRCKGCNAAVLERDDLRVPVAALPSAAWGVGDLLACEECDDGTGHAGTAQRWRPAGKLFVSEDSLLLDAADFRFAEPATRQHAGCCHAKHPPKCTAKGAAEEGGFCDGAPVTCSSCSMRLGSVISYEELFRICGRPMPHCAEGLGVRLDKRSVKVAVGGVDLIASHGAAAFASAAVWDELQDRRGGALRALAANAPGDNTVWVARGHTADVHELGRLPPEEYFRALDAADTFLEVRVVRPNVFTVDSLPSWLPLSVPDGRRDETFRLAHSRHLRPAMEVLWRPRKHVATDRRPDVLLDSDTFAAFQTHLAASSWTRRGEFFLALAQRPRALDPDLELFDI